MTNLPLPERITDTHAFFWGSIYSNWYECRFMWESLVFKNSETALMYAKAVHFGDEYHARKILESNHDPEYVKGEGRKVRPYDDEEWASVRKDIMTSILKEKFHQNRDLFEILCDHKELHIVEASPVDKIWGIGLHWTNDKVLDSRNWNGDNLLGECIMDTQRHFGLRK